MEVPEPGVESELQLPAYIIATATLDASCVCELHHSPEQHQILNTLNEARDGIQVLMDTSRVLNRLSHNRNPKDDYFPKEYIYILISTFQEDVTVKIKNPWYKLVGGDSRCRKGCLKAEGPCSLDRVIALSLNISSLAEYT